MEFQECGELWTCGKFRCPRDGATNTEICPAQRSRALSHAQAPQNSVIFRRLVEFDTRIDDETLGTKFNTTSIAVSRYRKASEVPGPQRIRKKKKMTLRFRSLLPQLRKIQVC